MPKTRNTHSPRQHLPPPHLPLIAPQPPIGLDPPAERHAGHLEENFELHGEGAVDGGEGAADEGERQERDAVLER
jgi:hypothetical protein